MDQQSPRFDEYGWQGAYQPSTPLPPPPKKRRRWPWAVGGVVLLFATAGVIGGNSAPTAAAPTAPAAGPASSVSDGIYEIGAGVVPGKYKTPGPGTKSIINSCYLEISDGSGRLEGISRNDNLTGPGVITLPAGKVFKAQGGCTWTKVG